MSTVEGVQYRGGKSQLLFEYPTVLSTPTVLMISPHMHHDIPPRYSNFKGWYPPTVLNTLHGTHDIPHMHHDIPHGTEHPPQYSRYPSTFIMISPHGTQDVPPRYSRCPPMVLMISSHGTHDIPTVLNTPHGIAHTLYRVVYPAHC